MTDTQNDTLVKIKFQGCRRELFRNTMGFPLEANDTVIIEAERGEDIGITLPYLKEKRAEQCNQENLTVLRKASSEDVQKDNDNRKRQKMALQFCQRQVEELELPMKLIDVEYRLDRKKITFYFTSDERIDFRELVKILAAEFKTRIEMRQISSREETRRCGGIGLCGEPLCCHQFIDDFEPISTQLVKEQNLPMNPTKISGPCGKLKCCFRYEHDMYAEFLNKYPPYGTKVAFSNRTGIIEKIDIFQKTIAIRFDNDEMEEFPVTEFENKYKVIN
ncbi:MAG TPA: hypothetical protein DHW42_05510 [Candidatus Marinimicrobia bacterium]|nr:hypothetical protein [Candidatus Neomarinimicrobiota bacterium]